MELRRKTSLEKLNKKAIDTGIAIKTLEDSIVYARGQLVEEATLVLREANSTIKTAEIAKGRAEGILLQNKG